MEIRKITSRRDKRRFINFPHDLYADDPYYVPALYWGVADLINPKKNPWFKKNVAEFFLAEKNGTIVGRIAAIRNNNYNEFSGATAAFFGFYDVVDDRAVSDALLDTASQWAREQGLTEIIGPTNFSTNDTAGLLIEGWNGPPVINMTYNYPYYQDFIEGYGMIKGMDLLAYILHQEQSNLRSVKLADRIQERLEKQGYSFRQANMKDFKQEVRRLRDVYISAWEDNWGFVPPTQEEFDFIAKEMKMIADPELIPIVEYEGEVVAFALSIPDINQILHSVPRGKLFPTGIFKLLTGKKNINLCRIILLGVRPEHRGKGIDGIFYARALTGKYPYGEASWILENNPEMRTGLEKLKAYHDRTYRIYKMAL